MAEPPKYNYEEYWNLCYCVRTFMQGHTKINKEAHLKIVKYIQDWVIINVHYFQN